MSGYCQDCGNTLCICSEIQMHELRKALEARKDERFMFSAKDKKAFTKQVMNMMDTDKYIDELEAENKELKELLDELLSVTSGLNWERTDNRAMFVSVNLDKLNRLLNKE